jgi:hypothetical protein
LVPNSYNDEDVSPSGAYAMPDDPDAESAQDYSCIAVLRLGEYGKQIPEFQTQEVNQDWTQHFHPNPSLEDESIHIQTQQWTSCKYPPGISFMHTFTPEGQNPGFLSRYAGFLSKAQLVVFADNIGTYNS